MHTPPNLPNLVQVQTGAETQVPPTRDLEFSFPGPELSLADSFLAIRVCLQPAYTAQCKSEQEVLKVRIVDPEYNGGRGASSVYAGNGDKLWSAPPSLARFDQMQVWWTRMQEISFTIIIVSRLLLLLTTCLALIYHHTLWHLINMTPYIDLSNRIGDSMLSRFNLKRRKSKKSQRAHLN